MHKLIDYVYNQLDELDRKAEGGKLTLPELEYADTLAHLLKNMLKTEKMSDDDYSYEMSRRSYRNSYARRRDSMGRYSRGYSRDYSRDYSREEDM